MEWLELKRTGQFFILFFVFTLLHSQPADTTQSNPNKPQKIELKTFVESSTVPLNRSVVFHIEVSWEGRLNWYRIEPVSQPVLTNLLLEGSGSENRLDPLPNGNFKATKSITYRFKPLEMGMAYIDGVDIKYINQQTNQEDHLNSQRVMVEITEPIPENSGGTLKAFVYIILLVLFFGVTAYFLFVYVRKRKKARHSQAPIIPLPELYLSRLTQEVDPRGTNLTEMTSRLSRIFREYLSEEFEIHARESSTSEIESQLRELEVDETDRQKIVDVLGKLDIIKFTGKNMDPADFTSIYGTIEAFLIKRKQMQDSNQVELKEE